MALHPLSGKNHLPEDYMAIMEVSSRFRECGESGSPIRNRIRKEMLRSGIMVIAKWKKARIALQHSAAARFHRFGLRPRVAQA